MAEMFQGEIHLYSTHRKCYLNSFLTFILLLYTLVSSPRTIQCHLNTNTRLILNIHMTQVCKRKLAILQRTNITFLSYENTVNICIKILAKIYFYLRNIAALLSTVATLIIQVGFFMSIEYFLSTSDKGQYSVFFYVCLYHM